MAPALAEKAGEWVHWSFALVATVLAIASFLPPRSRPRVSIMTAAALGVALILVGASETLPQPLSLAVTLAGGLTLAGCHLYKAWRRTASI